MTTPFAQLSALPWADVPGRARERDRSHGRREHRAILAVTVPAGLRFPYAAQAFRIRRTTRHLDGRPKHTETVYGITSLKAHRAGPAHLGAYVRGHWGIKNRLHWVRDVTFDEDRSQVRTGNGPRAMAALRNLAISTALPSGRSHQHRRSPPPRLPRLHPSLGHARPHVNNFAEALGAGLPCRRKCAV
ncbi:ISAs1 family transposase [Streptomyces sp. NPDC002537]